MKIVTKFLKSLTWNKKTATVELTKLWLRISGMGSWNEKSLYLLIYFMAN